MREAMRERGEGGGVVSITDEREVERERTREMSVGERQRVRKSTVGKTER